MAEKTWVQVLADETANWKASAGADASSIRVAMAALEDLVNAATTADLLTFEERGALLAQING